MTTDVLQGIPIRPFCACLLLAVAACGASADSPDASPRKAMRPEIERLTHTLADSEAVESEHLGEAGVASKVYPVFEKLRSIATRDELVALLDDASPNVQAYAFLGLAEANDPELLALVVAHLGRMENVQVWSGCIHDTEPLASYFVETSRAHLSKAQGQELDERLAFGAWPIQERPWALAGLPPAERYYAQVRALAEHGETAALIPLARYHKAADLELLRRALVMHGDELPFDALTAVAEYHDAAMFPVLEAMVRSTAGSKYFYNAWKPLYAAIAGYEDARAAAVLALPLEGSQFEAMRDYHAEDIFAAVEARTNPIYDALKLRLWELGQATPSSLSLLFERAPAQSAAIASRMLVSPPRGLLTADQARAMLAGLEGAAPAVVSEVVAAAIGTADPGAIEAFTDFAAAHGDPRFVAPLVARLRTSDNRYILAPVAAALLSYRDDGLTRIVDQTRAGNADLDELLKLPREQR